MYEKTSIRQRIKNFDIMGHSLLGIARVFGFYPYFFTLFIILFPIDIFSELQKYRVLPAVISSNYYSLQLYNIIRIPITSIFAIQTCRMMSNMVISVAVGCHLTLSIIYHIDRISSESMSLNNHIRYGNQMSQLISKYKQLAILFNIGHGYICTTTIIALSVNLAIEVVCNFVSLKLYHVIPMPFYLFFPSVSILIPVTFMILLPIMVNTYENGVNRYGKWKQNIYHCSLHEMKYLKKKLRG
jgi:hypothetical protein